MIKFKFLIIILLVGCKSSNNTIQNKEANFTPLFIPGPPILVYKTKADYNNFVPVLLSDDKKSIVSYPAPADIKTSIGYQSPSVLENGYLLDNRGINMNVAFLNITYEEYFKQDSLMSLEEMYAMIIDKDPLVELCNCGNSKSLPNPVTQLNRLITDKKLRVICKVLK